MYTDLKPLSYARNTAEIAAESIQMEESFPHFPQFFYFFFQLIR
jgi:hypothetical protein